MSLCSVPRALCVALCLAGCQEAGIPPSDLGSEQTLPGRKGVLRHPGVVLVLECGISVALEVWCVHTLALGKEEEL